MNKGFQLQTDEYVLYRRQAKKKTELEWVGPYLVTNKQGDWYELTSIKQDKPPFYAHARQLKRYYADPNHPHQHIAHNDDPGIIEKIVSHIAGPKGINNRREVLIGVNYEGFPLDIHWLPLSDVQYQAKFIQYCLDHQINTWILPEAKLLHKDLIESHKSKQASTTQPNNI
jgi:hypothetical protein